MNTKKLTTTYIGYRVKSLFMGLLKETMDIDIAEALLYQVDILVTPGTVKITVPYTDAVLQAIRDNGHSGIRHSGDKLTIKIVLDKEDGGLATVASIPFKNTIRTIVNNTLDKNNVLVCTNENCIGTMDRAKDYVVEDMKGFYVSTSGLPEALKTVHGRLTLTLLPAVLDSGRVSVKDSTVLLNIYDYNQAEFKLMEGLNLDPVIDGDRINIVLTFKECERMGLFTAKIINVYTTVTLAICGQVD